MVRSVFAALVIQRRGWQTLFSLWNFKRRFSAEVRCEKQRSGTKREGGRVPRPRICVSLPALGRTGRGTPWPQGHIWETFPQRVTGEDRCFLRLKPHIGLASTHGVGRPRNCLQRRLVAPGNLRLSMLRFGFQQKISFHGFLALTCSLVAALAAGERSPEGCSVPSDSISQCRWESVRKKPGGNTGLVKSLGNVAISVRPAPREKNPSLTHRPSEMSGVADQPSRRAPRSRRAGRSHTCGRFLDTRVPTLPTVLKNPHVWLTREPRGSCSVLQESNSGPFKSCVRSRS